MLCNHFHKEVCQNAPYLVQILEKRDGNRSNACGDFYAPIASKAKQREKEWVLKLQTAFPN